MVKVMVMLEVNEERVKEVSGKDDLENAITTELDWLRNSGMQVDSWQFTGLNKEVDKNINKVINLEKLSEYLEEDMIFEFSSDKECMDYFNIYDFQNFKSVEDMKQYQGEYGFGVGEKWYHINYDEALDVWEKDAGYIRESFAMKYKDSFIFEKDGEFTVGSECNEGFEDCTLENLDAGDEYEMAKWCMEQENKVLFLGLRGELEGEFVSCDRYMEHLNKYQTESELSFVDNDLIVPCVRFASIEKAKEFLDWVAERSKGKEPQKISLDEKVTVAKGQVDKDVKSFLEDEVCKFFVDDASYGDKKLLSIIRYGEKFANYYSEDSLVHGFGLVGPFDSLDKAEEMLKKHRPQAVECKDASEIKKLFYGKDKKQVLSGISKFLNKELVKGDCGVQR